MMISPSAPPRRARHAPTGLALCERDRAKSVPAAGPRKRLKTASAPLAAAVFAWRITPNGAHPRTADGPSLPGPYGYVRPVRSRGPRAREVTMSDRVDSAFSRRTFLEGASVMAGGTLPARSLLFHSPRAAGSTSLAPAPPPRLLPLAAPRRV